MSQNQVLYSTMKSVPKRKTYLVHVWFREVEPNIHLVGRNTHCDVDILLLIQLKLCFTV